MSDEDGVFGKVRLVLAQGGDGITGTWQAHPHTGLGDRIEMDGTVGGKMVVHRQWYGAMRYAELTLLLESKTTGSYPGCIVALTKALVADNGARIEAHYMTMTPQCPTGGGLIASGLLHFVRE